MEPQKVGRPSEYPGDDSIKQTAHVYIATCGREQTKLPKLTEFYRRIGISRQCADEWKDKYLMFARICSQIEELQQEQLIDDGLFGGKEVNASMAIFLLKANHGMIETEKKIVEGNYNIDLNGIIGRSQITTQTENRDSGPSRSSN